MSSSAPSRYGLFVASAVVLALAGGIWNQRSQHMAASNTATQERLQTQQDVALLLRAFVADNQLKYSAISNTVATYGQHEMTTEAKLTRTPQSLSIVYLKGAREGLHSGFNQKWFWRQSKPGAPMEAYASVQVEAPAMAAQRMVLMIENYSIQRRPSRSIAGRAVEIVEIRPLHNIDGAIGPGRILGIDRETGLTLFTQTYNFQWRSVMKSTLSNVDFTPEINAETFATPGQMFHAAQKNPWMAEEMGTDRADVARATGIEPPRPGYTPESFQFDSVGVHRCDGTKAGLGALSRYTDGLNTLTIFAIKKMKTESGAAPGQACDFGPGTLMMRDTAQGHLIAVGDLPPQTLKRVLESTPMRLAKP